MKTQNRTPVIRSLVLALAIIPALVFGQPIPNGPKEVPKVAAPPKVPKEAPEAPKVAEQPKVPKEAPKTPRVVEQPKVPKEAPKIPKVPQVVQQPKVPNAPNIPKVPQVVQQPKVPNAPNIPKLPQVVQQPKVPNAPNIPQNIELPKVPKTPVVVKIPAVKEPPKAPNIPKIVKVQDAPKLPNSPAVAKIPDAPKVPKNPVLTKIPDAPIVPKSKPTIGKVPDAPKFPKPTIISAAKDQKIPNTSGLIVKKIVEVPQTPGSNIGNNSATEATVQEAAAIIRGNLCKTDPGGSKADLPAIDRSVKALTGVPVADEGSGNALADSISLLQGTGSLGSPTLPDTNINNKAPVDQGFAEKPTSVDQGTVQGITGNPLNALNPGGVGGPAAADALQLEYGKTAGAWKAPAAELALALQDSEASVAGIQFLDEPAKVRVAVMGPLPPGTKIFAKVTDLYGKETSLPPLTAKGAGKLEVFDLDLPAHRERPIGMFRVEAFAGLTSEKPASPVAEILVTRLPRPKYWGKDAPDSPFGIHVNPIRRELIMAKATCHNWARLHDTGNNITSWWYVEPEQGKWTWRDTLLKKMRAQNMLVLGLLSTSPGWANGSPGKSFWDHAYLQPKNLDAWDTYVREVTTHYGADVAAWEVWNEPWLTNF